jgi:rRNA maturation RNase YbeY
MTISNPPENYGSSGLYLFNETSHSLPVDRTTIREIVNLIEENESYSFSLIETVFVDEDTIVALNQEYLNRNYVTDIITFRYDEQMANQGIEGTLYCCAPRIYEQAKAYKQPPEREFNRIIIHGLLHLTGYDDQYEEAQQKMRNREDFYLERLGE